MLEVKLSLRYRFLSNDMPRKVLLNGLGGTNFHFTDRQIIL